MVGGSGGTSLRRSGFVPLRGGRGGLGHRQHGHEEAFDVDGGNEVGSAEAGGGAVAARLRQHGEHFGAEELPHRARPHAQPRQLAHLV